MAEPSPILTEPVGKVLRDQSVPMAVGLVFMILVNLIDTYWASKLGTDELAAMSFSFPVIGVVVNVSIGLMIGTSVAVARVLGAGQRARANRISTHALLLGVVIVGVVSGVGLLTQDALFSLLGAPADLLPTISRYMTIWYASTLVLVVPMFANGILRAHGDAKTPRNVMIIGAVVNAILDPLFIFGWGPVPAMHLEGAALATACARLFGGAYSFAMLFRYQTLDLHLPKPAQLMESWKRILAVGVPATITNVLGPVATAMLTAIVATFGAAAVAAYGIGARVEGLLLMAPLALSSGLSPFIGQNWGAHLPDRVSEGFNKSVRFCILWGVGVLLLLLPTAPLIASAFTDEPAVARDIELYLWIVPIGYAPYGVMLMVNSSFNAMDRAIRSTVLSVLRSIVFAVPVAFVLGQLLGLNGVFIGLVVGSFCASLLGLRWMFQLLDPARHGELEPGAVLEGHEAQFLVEGVDEGLGEAMSALIAHVAALHDVELRRIRLDAVGFFAEGRQLGHIHPSGHLDLPLPSELGAVLVSEGIVEHHRLHDGAGWFTHPLHSGREVAEAEWLLKLAHLLVELCAEGPDGPHAAAERAALPLSEAARAALDVAVQRASACRRSSA